MKGEKQKEMIDVQEMRDAVESIQDLLEPLESEHHKDQNSSAALLSARDTTHLSEQDLLKALDSNLKRLQESLQRLGHKRWVEECAKCFAQWLQDYSGHRSLRLLHNLVESCAAICGTYQFGAVQTKLNSRQLEIQLEKMRQLEPEEETYDKRGVGELIDKLLQALFSLPIMKKLDFGPHLEAPCLSQPEDELDFVETEDLSINEIESASSENSEEELDATPRAEEWKKMLLPRLN